MSTTLRIEQVSKRFGAVSALDQVSLRVQPGEFVALVGPSGCGKTTLLRIIAGLEQADSGHIYLDNERVNDIAAGKRGVQLIFQNYALWPHMKVLDERRYSNISFPLRVRKWTREQITGHVEGITRRVGLDRELFGRKPDELSSGQKQRVALARAMTTSPRVFLLDEPLTNLDPISRVRVRDEIRSWHRQIGTTTIIVTHILTDAFALGDRIALMRDGQIVQVGTERELRERPADDFVREFLRS